jgi:dTDP-4-amino-4,6-dideoxygalactose transaminase
VAREPWRERYLVFGAPYIGPEERAEVMACIDSGWLGTGPRVARLQRDFQAYLGGGPAVGVNSCTAALPVAAGARPRAGRRGTSPMTFCATVNAIMQVSRPFADCDRRP